MNKNNLTFEYMEVIIINIKNIVLLLTLFTCSSNLPASTHTVSWYGGKFHGRTTASGEVYNKYALTCASNSHKMGTRLKVTNVKSGKSVIVRVNDTGGFKKYGRTLDLSMASFSKIANLQQGIAKVKIETVK